MMGKVLRQPTSSSSHSRNHKSEEAFWHQVTDRLAANGYLSGNEVDIEYDDGVVLLRGHVNSFHEKQVVQEIVRKVSGIRIIINRLTVDRSEFSDSIKRESPFCV